MAFTLHVKKLDLLIPPDLEIYCLLIYEINYVYKELKEFVPGSSLQLFLM